MTQIERLTRVEEQVNELRIKVGSLEDKIDELLALKYKGAGAFWLMTLLFGSGFAYFLTWIKGN